MPTLADEQLAEQFHAPLLEALAWRGGAPNGVALWRPVGEHLGALLSASWRNGAPVGDRAQVKLVTVIQQQARRPRRPRPIRAAKPRYMQTDVERRGVRDGLDQRG
jgi:hypothetical protein